MEHLMDKTGGAKHIGIENLWGILERIVMDYLRPLWVWLVAWLIPAVVWAEDSSIPENVGASGLGYLSAAIAVGASTLGAGIAVAVVGAAAMGAIGEKPELSGRALIFIGLAEGIAIYGLIVALMILAKL